MTDQQHIPLTDPEPRRVVPVSMVDAVADDLRTRMFRGEVSMRETLTEQGLAMLYDVARPTAKAAIERLVTEGLLVRNRNRSARVVQMSPDDIHDLYFTRYVIESEAIRQLSGRQFVPGEALLAIQRMREIGHSHSAATVEPDMQFHGTLVRSLESPRLSAMYQGLISGVRLCMSQVQALELLEAAEIADEHDHIVERIEAGDASSASEALANHLARARDALVHALSLPNATDGSR